MKKAMALLLAMVTAMSFATTAMADTASTASDNDKEIIGIVLEKDEDGIALESGTLLTPGKEYKFPIYVKEEGNKTSPLTEDDLKSYNLRLEHEEGKSSLDSFKVVKEGDKNYLEVKVKAGWPTKQTEVSYRMKLVGRRAGMESVEALDINFLTGYEFASDSMVSSLGEDDYITADPNAPVFTKEQLERIASVNNYKKVTFANGSWTFQTSINDMDSINMLNNENAIKEIISAYPDNDFKFITFPAGTKFPGKGTLTVDVSDLEAGFKGNYYVYRYLNGKLTKLDASFVEEDETLVLETNTLGRFVITDKEIKDGSTVVEGMEPSSSETSSNSSSSENGSNNSGNSGKPNHETGVGASAAIATAVIAISGAALALSKKSR